MNTAPATGDHARSIAEEERAAMTAISAIQIARATRCASLIVTNAACVRELRRYNAA
jgi:hypothetical protein